MTLPTAIRNPAGTWSLRGNTLFSLVFRNPDGSPPTDSQRDIAALAGPALAGLRPRTFKTREEAMAAAIAEMEAL